QDHGELRAERRKLGARLLARQQGLERGALGGEIAALAREQQALECGHPRIARRLERIARAGAVAFRELRAREYAHRGALRRLVESRQAVADEADGVIE